MKNEAKATTTWTADGLCSAHGLKAGANGCVACAQGQPVSRLAPLTGIAKDWAEATTLRMKPGRDLYRAGCR